MISMIEKLKINLDVFEYILKIRLSKILFENLNMKIIILSTYISI